MRMLLELWSYRYLVKGLEVEGVDGIYLEIGGADQKVSRGEDMFPRTYTRDTALTDVMQRMFSSRVLYCLLDYEGIWTERVDVELAFDVGLEFEVLKGLASVWHL